MPEKYLVAVLFTAMLPAAGLVLAAFALHLTSRARLRDRELLSQERLAAIQKGLEVPIVAPISRRPGRSALQTGILLVGSGVGLSLSLAAVQPPGSQGWAWGALLVCVGAANLVYWHVGGREEWQKEHALDESVGRAYLACLERLADGQKRQAP